MNPLVAQVLAAARHEIGTREIGTSNTGKRVGEYQAATPLGGTGWPWCDAFVSFCMLTALGRDLCDKVWLRSASCDLSLAWAKHQGILTTTPVAGCAGLVMASKSDASHIFLVEEVMASACHTIEGNTNLSGAREGIGVFARVRPFSSRYLYINWARLLPKTAQAKPATVKADDTEPLSPFADVPEAQLWVGSSNVTMVPLLNGRYWLPAWKWAKWMKADLGWNMEAQSVTLDGREVPAQPIIVEGRAWVPVRTLAEFSAMNVSQKAGRVVITR